MKSVQYVLTTFWFSSLFYCLCSTTACHNVVGHDNIFFTTSNFVLLFVYRKLVMSADIYVSVRLGSLATNATALGKRAALAFADWASAPTPQTATSARAPSNTRAGSEFYSSCDPSVAKVSKKMWENVSWERWERWESWLTTSAFVQTRVRPQLSYYHYLEVKTNNRIFRKFSWLRSVTYTWQETFSRLFKLLWIRASYEFIFWNNLKY